MVGTTRPEPSPDEQATTPPVLKPALAHVPLNLLLAAPNQITVIRTIIAMVVAAWAFHSGTWQWLVVGYVVYWAGDSLDGEWARWRKQESLLGAVFDIVCDRASTLLLAGAFIATYPEVVGPLTVYLIQFAVLDTMLSLAFLLWPSTLSPNYFYKVDRPIYLWNWSRAGKAVNTAGVIITLIVGYRWDLMVIPYTIAGLIVILKIVSLIRLIRILTGAIQPAPGSGKIFQR